MNNNKESIKEVFKKDYLPLKNWDQNLEGKIFI